MEKTNNEILIEISILKEKHENLKQQIMSKMSEMVVLEEKMVEIEKIYKNKMEELEKRGLLG